MRDVIGSSAVASKDAQQALVTGLQRIAICATELVGEECKIRPTTGAYGWDAVALAVGPEVWIGESRRLEDDRPMAFLFSSRLARALGAALLMMPETPGQMTEELEESLQEVINILVGGWNGDGRDQRTQISNSVEDLAIRSITHKELGMWVEEEALQAACLEVEFRGRSELLGLVAPPGALHLPPHDGDPAEGDDSGHAAGPATRASIIEPQAQPAGPGALAQPTSGPVARFLVCDVSGALLAWLQEQIASGAVQLSHPGDPAQARREAKAVLLLEPSAEQVVALNAFQTLSLKE